MNPTPDHPFSAIWAAQSAVVLDGGLATTLEAHGLDLHDPLWSAKALLQAPGVVARVHREFLEAGADCIATVTYQASYPGLRAHGLDDVEVTRVLSQAIDIATEERDRFWSIRKNRSGARARPLVAASIGPYGAYLADGSEYTGAYDCSKQDLWEFHERRWHLFADSAADLLACETVPSLVEVEVLLELLQSTPQRWAWLSFSCRDEGHLADGTPLEEVAAMCDPYDRVAGLGVNCVAPSLVAPAVSLLRQHSRHSLFAYPNSGEGYDADGKLWTDTPEAHEWHESTPEWLRMGITGVGGCCRVTPTEISQIRDAVIRTSALRIDRSR